MTQVRESYKQQLRDAAEGKPTSAPPRRFQHGRNGPVLVFRCYKLPGLFKTEWRSDCKRFETAAYGGCAGYWLKVDGEAIVSEADPRGWHRFRTLDTAMTRAAKIVAGKN